MLRRKPGPPSPPCSTPRAPAAWSLCWRRRCWYASRCPCSWYPPPTRCGPAASPRRAPSTAALVRMRPADGTPAHHVGTLAVQQKAVVARPTETLWVAGQSNPRFLLNPKGPTSPACFRKHDQTCRSWQALCPCTTPPLACPTCAEGLAYTSTGGVDTSSGGLGSFPTTAVIPTGQTGGHGSGGERAACGPHSACAVWLAWHTCMPASLQDIVAGTPAAAPPRLQAPRIHHVPP